MHTETKPDFDVVVTCHNYAGHVRAAVDSALAQVPPPRKVIVIDDGSTDGSARVLQEAYGTHPGVELVVQRNQGQLAAFVAGLGRCMADVVCFLDADDLWEAGYLAALTRVYSRRDVDFVHVNVRLTGRTERLWSEEREDRDLGYSILSTYFLQHWEGSPTSGLSLRRELAARVLSLPAHFYPLWKVRADDCLVYGAGILGARKAYVAQPLVRYQHHGDNLFLERGSDRYQEFLYRLNVSSLCGHYGQLMGLRDQSLMLAKAEFRTKPTPTRADLQRYRDLLRRSPLNWRQRLEHGVGIWWHYRGRRGRRAP